MKTMFKWLSAMLLFLPSAAGVPSAEAQEGKIPSPAGQVAQDPTLLLYQRLVQKVRSELQRSPEVVPPDLGRRPLSLDECLDIALRNNGKLLIAREKLLVAKMKYTEARRNILPTLSTTGYLQEGLLTSKTFKGEQYKVSGEYDVIDGGKKFLSLDKAKKDYILAKKTYERLRNDILYQTRQSYYYLYRAETSYGDQQELLQKASNLASKGKAMLDKQLLRNVDYIGLLGAFQEISSQMLAAGQELTTARMTLCQMLHLYPDNPIPIVPLGQPKILNQIRLEDALTLAFRYRPDVVIAIVQKDIAKIEAQIAETSSALSTTMKGHFGHKGEAFNEATEGIQSRPDMRLEVKSSLPLDKHTLRYEPNFVKEVPDVGATTSTVYNEHNVFFDFFNNWNQRDILEAKITYHDNLDDLETLKKAVVVDVARRYSDVQLAIMGMETSNLGYELAQERLKVTLAGAGQAGVAPGEELAANVGVSMAKRRVLTGMVTYLASVADLNRSIGIDNYADPIQGSIQPVKDEPFRRIKKVWEFWRDDDLEQDADLLPTKFYQDYLPGASQRSD